MPLIKSGSRAAVSQNIREMVHSGYPQQQAIAASLSNARRYGAKMAAGGTSWIERSAARGLVHEGFIKSPVPGRTDKLPIGVGGGAYILPADHVAAIGQGNSLAGASILNKMLKLGPYGSAAGALRPARPVKPQLSLKATALKPPKFAAGGAPHVPIIAAGGEYAIPPHKVAEIGGGDMNRGHKILDHWVLSTRKQHIKTLRGLKPPKK